MSKIILAVDDDKMTRDLIEAFLTEEGYIIKVAESVMSAMKILTEPDLPSLIISDVQMPVQTGFHFLMKLRIHPKYKLIPVIMLTAHSGYQEVQKALQLGAKDYVTKPFTKEKLVEKVKVICPAF